MSLLERDGAIATLDQLLAGVRAGAEGQLVLVGGEAGVGKTALLRGFCDAQADALCEHVQATVLGQADAVVGGRASMAA